MVNIYQENMTDHDFIIIQQGTKQMTTGVLLPFNIIYLILLITGLFGNFITCKVILHFKMMHTPTNYYLLNLGISDLCVLILGLPQDLYMMWSRYPYPFGEFGCITKSLLSEMGMCTSVLTATGFTVERYIAICHPMIKPSDRSNKRRTIKIIFCIWLMSVICSLPLALQMGLQQLTRNDSSTNFSLRTLENSTMCTQIEKKALPNSFLISFIVFFVTPLSLMSILYLKIGLTIRHSICHRERQVISIAEHKRRTQMRSRKAAIKMLVAIIVLFFLCLAPFHAERLMVTLIPESMWNIHQILWNIHEFLYSISGILYYFNCAVNPILYNIMSHKFRKGFWEVIQCQPSLSSFPQISLSDNRYLKMKKTRNMFASEKLEKDILNYGRPNEKVGISRSIICLKRTKRYNTRDCYDAFNVTVNSGNE